MSLQDYSKNATGLARNPLGIVALFIGLSEVMATLVLTVSRGPLSDVERIALVSFLVLFPIGVYGAFIWLVICHHTKLYGPGDFKNDETFWSLSIEGQRRKLREEVEEADATPDRTDPAEEMNHPSPAQGDPQQTPKDAPRSETDVAPESSARKATFFRAQTRHLVSEELVLRKLEAEWKTPINRSVLVGTTPGQGVILDGVAEVGGETRVVEIRGAHLLRQATVVNGITQLINAATLMAAKRRRVRAVLVLVLFRSGDPVALRKQARALVEARTRGLPFPVDVRVYSFPALASEFGIEIPE